MHKHRANKLVLPFLILGIGGIAAMALVPNFIHRGCQGTLTGCKSNLKNIGTACEIWSSDHKGKYPVTLSQLTPNYLKTLPSCPEAQRDTYSEGYRSSYRYERYTFYCAGTSHSASGAAANYPQYTSTQGLVT